jgi:HPt (histidine-containing phosphotransfer) domain-containing protein
LKAYEGALHKAILQLQSLRASGPAEALHPPLGQPAPGAVPNQSALRAQSAAVQLARLAHTLKSSSASVGALNLARACEACEKKLNLQPETDVGPETEQLLTPAEAALRAVQAMLAR